MDWTTDGEFDEYVLAEVDVAGKHWELKTDEGWILRTPAVPGSWLPAAGDRARYFGQGIGRPVRGVVLLRDGEPALVSRYRTASEHNADMAAEQAQRDREKQAELEATQTQRDARWMSLPDEFQARQRRFVAGSREYRRDFEEYELFVCEQAWAIVQAGISDIKAFSALKFDEQRALVPAISDGHSGNTFGMACRLAHWWLTQRENLALEHGALTPLVGCEAYGCTHAS